MTDSIEQQLHSAASWNVEQVSSLLRDHPDLDVNWGDGRTALHTAASNNKPAIVKLLLAHPNINVNLRGSTGKTPFSLGCYHGHLSVFRLFLNDPRVNVTLEDTDGCSPLWCASRDGYREVIEWLIASGRDLGDIKNKKGTCWGGNEYYTALEIARDFERTEVVSVLERFIDNPALTRHELRGKLGVLDELAAEVFALIVFLCDDLLQLRPPALTTTTIASAAANRFFAIASQLPMELQMILCHRAFGSMKQNILRKDSETAFKSLARILRLFQSN